MADIERIAPDTIRLERYLPAPVDTVWRYLTDAELRGRWFAAGPLEPHVGGALTLTFDHDRLSSEDVPYPERYAASQGHVANEQVVAWEPPHILAFTFGGQNEGVARFELTPDGDGTRLVLTHSGISSRDNTLDFGGGWTSHLAVLGEVLAGRMVPDFWALHSRCEAEVRAAIG